MLSLTVANQVRFRTRKGDVCTAVPVTVEFEKFTRNEKSARIVNIAEWKKLAPGDGGTKEVTSPTDLLHAVVALYDTCIPDMTVQNLYRIVCGEGTRTLLLLRDTSEILQDWEIHATYSTTSQSREDSLGEINNNPPTTQGPKDGKQTERSTPQSLDPEEGQEEEGQPSNDANTVRSSPDDVDRTVTPETTTQDEWRPWIPKCNNNTPERSRANDNVPDRGPPPNVRNRQNNNQMAFLNDGSSRGEQELPHESPFSDIFSDSGEDSEMGSDMDDDDEHHEAFSRGLDAFLRAVVGRKKERRLAMERYSLQSTHVGIEHRLIASATFKKNYRLPGTRVVYLSLLAVRRRFRRCGIGRYLIKKLKSPSQVGPYDALVVRADSSTLNFFLKNGFTDDIILNSRFRDLEEDRWPNGSNLVCYLPPFDGHYPPLPGVQEWNTSEAVAAMDDEIEKWRQKSLEAYQAQVTCLTRLQQEVLRLHNLLRRQDATIQFLKNENQRLQNRLSKVLSSSFSLVERKSTQALIEVLEKEAADFERLCCVQTLQHQENS